MKNIIFALAACLLLTCFTTNSFAQTKAKKGKFKTKQGTLKLKKNESSLLDSLSSENTKSAARVQTRAKSSPQVNKQFRKAPKGPVVPGSIWDSLPPQVKGSKAKLKLQSTKGGANGQAARKDQTKRMDARSLPKSSKLQQSKMRQKQAAVQKQKAKSTTPRRKRKKN